MTKPFVFPKMSGWILFCMYAFLDMNVFFLTAALALPLAMFGAGALMPKLFGGMGRQEPTYISVPSPSSSFGGGAYNYPGSFGGFPSPSYGQPMFFGGGGMGGGLGGGLGGGQWGGASQFQGQGGGFGGGAFDAFGKRRRRSLRRMESTNVSCKSIIKLGFV